MERINQKLGVDLKFKVDISELGEDNSLDEIAYKLIFSAGGANKTYEITVDEEDGQTLPSGVRKVNGSDHELIVACPTASLARGNLFLTVQAEVPDEDFPDGFRHEEKQIDLFINLV